MKFSEMNLHPDLQRGLADAEYLTCMPVQEQVLSQAFGGQDLYVQSQTGTGKTAAYLVVVFQRLLAEEMLHGKKALIMVPTRELAVQVENEAKVIGKHLPFKIGSFYGGVGYAQQTALLRDNAQILIGTPGRVLDLNESGQMNLMDTAFLVLDEADRMFDMGFYPDLRKLIKVVPPVDRRQTMLFSATLNSWVKNLAWEYTRNPFEIAIEPDTVTVQEIEQLLYHVSSTDKMKLLLGILKRETPESAIIFCNTKRYTEIIAKRLRLNGFDCEYIMGDLPQPKRLKIIEDIKAGKTRFLVATDVAARGLDIEGLAMVVNYDLPNEAENYVHRIGRTARAGKTGKAITFSSEQDVYELPPIERYIGGKIPSETATEALFAADESEGKRVQTDYYEDRGGRGDRRSQKRPPREGSAYSAQGKGRRGASRNRARDDNERGQWRKERYRSANTVQAQAQDTFAKPDGIKLSEMTSEQRMAYYKQKYEGKGRETSTQRRNSSGGGANRRERDNEGRDNARKGRNRRNDRPRKPTDKAAQPTRAPQKTVDKPSGNQGKAPAKKGILSRILGIFQKK